ncbi:Oxysterol binding protein [Kappamyces sp. JEL0680]|nr:Oxysterol binding protein [Kappamyces sp. JEL0680]
MSVFVDLMGKTRITSLNGCEAEIEFVPKGWFTGEYFTIKGTIQDQSVSTPYCTIAGKWTEESTATIDGATQTLFDAQSEKPHNLVIPPLEAQLDTESKKLWGSVTKALEEQDYAKVLTRRLTLQASELKSSIEEAQRALRKERKETGESWSPQHFDFVTPPASDMSGTTKRDPQHTGGEQSNESGHWMFRFT